MTQLDITKFKNFYKCKIVWITYLILFINLNNKIFLKNYNNISPQDQVDILHNLSDYTDVSNFNVFFKKIDLDIYPFIKNWSSTAIYKSLSYFFNNTPDSFNDIKAPFFSKLKNFYNTINVFLLPNFLFKRIDFYENSKTLLKSSVAPIMYKNTFFVNYDKYRTHDSFFFFLFYRYSINLLSIDNFTFFINFYSDTLKNLFYNNFHDYFISKEKLAFCSSWSQNGKRFFINFFSVIEKNDDSYVQNKLFISYSSIKFVKYLNFNKRFNLIFPLKLIMIQHLRRMMICADIDSFMLFFKTYSKDFKLLFLNLNLPTNEIFENPFSDNSNFIICDIYFKLYKFKSVEFSLERYKPLIQSILSNDPIKTWDLFLVNFSNLLKITDLCTSEGKFEKVLIRYYFDCSIIFILKKKMLPLKKKKAQSISRRRYKQIVKSSKRRFWVF